MKKSYLSILTIAFLLIVPFKVSALGNHDTIVNQNGVEMTLEEYTNLKKIHSDLYIDTMTQDDFDQKMNMDFDTAQTVKKFYKTEYNHLNGQTSSTEVSELEYMQAGMNNNGDMPQATYIETGYEWLALGVVKTTDFTAYATITAHWKSLPTVRSYDVIAMRFTNMSVINGTQQGKQFYRINGTNNYIAYEFNGSNTNNQSNGFGISMNLLNTDVDELECEADTSLVIDNYVALTFASYQHAEQAVTLSESMNYTLTSIGLGSVIHFLNTSTMNKYDGMEGLYTYFTS